MGLQGWWPGFSKAFLTMQMAVLMGWEESRWRDGAILVVWQGKERITCQSHTPSLWPRTVKTLETLDHVHAHLDSTLPFLSLPFISNSACNTGPCSSDVQASAKHACKKPGLQRSPGVTPHARWCEHGFMIAPLVLCTSVGACTWRLCFCWQTDCSRPSVVPVL